MALHELRSITIGVPDTEPVALYYEAFGLERTESAVLSTTEGGRQLFLETAPTRRLVQLVVGVDDAATISPASARRSRRPDTRRPRTSRGSLRSSPRPG
jgi:hypothetical protein